MSFTNEDILTLAKAGFNAQQIAALNMVGGQTPNNPPTPTVSPAGVGSPSAPTPDPSNTNVVNAPTTVVNTQTQPVNAPVPAPAPAPAPVQTPAQPTIGDVLKSISGISEQLQLNNLQNMQQPKSATAEDILAEIINPPTPNK